MSTEDYIRELLDEREALDPASHAHRLVNDEIQKIQYGNSREEEPARQSGPRPYISPREVKTEDGGEVVKLTEKVYLPVEKYPKFNFVGKLLGPRGNTLKRLQAATRSRMSVLGKGSSKNKSEEEDLIKSEDPKHQHLKETLHVKIDVEAPSNEAHLIMTHAISEVKRYMNPENDEIREEQMRELTMLEHGMDQGVEEEAPQIIFAAPPARGRGRVVRGRGASRGGAGVIRTLPAGGIPPGAIIITGPPQAAPHPTIRTRGPAPARVVRGASRGAPRVAALPPRVTSVPTESYVTYDQYDATYDAAYEGYPETGEQPTVYYTEYPAETVEYPTVEYPPTSNTADSARYIKKNSLFANGSASQSSKPSGPSAIAGKLGRTARASSREASYPY